MGKDGMLCASAFATCLVAAMPIVWGAGNGRDAGSKITLCHVPHGGRANARTLVIGRSALKAHLGHGDFLGACEPACVATPPVDPVDLGSYFSKLKVSPDGSRLYATRLFLGDLVAVSAIDLSLIAAIPLVRDPEDLAIAPDGRRAAVAINSSPAQLIVVDTDPASPTFHQVVDDYMFDDENGSLGVAYRPDGTELYCDTQRPLAGAIHVFDPAGLTLQASLPIAPEQVSALPVGIAFTASSSKGYVAIFQSDPAHNIAVFSPSTHAVLGYLNLGLPFEGGGPVHVAMARTQIGERLWIANNSFAQSGITIVDPANDAVLLHFEVEGSDGEAPGICATPDGAKVIIALNGRIPVYDAATGTQTDWIDGIVGGNNCVVAPDGCHVFVSERGGRMHKIGLDELVPYESSPPQSAR